MLILLICRDDTQMVRLGTCAHTREFRMLIITERVTDESVLEDVLGRGPAGHNEKD